MPPPVETVVRTWKPSATFTRPADTTQYTVGDLVANSTSPTSVAAMVFDMGNSDNNGARKFYVVAARMHASKSTVTNASFRLHLYTALPQFVTGGDNSAYSTVVSGNNNWLADFDVTLTGLNVDGASGLMVPTEALVVPQLVDGQTPFSPTLLYGLLEARDVYTPASGETFALRLLVELNN